MHKRTQIRLALAAVAALLMLALAACGSSNNDSGSTTSSGSTSTSAPAALPGKGKPAVTLGAKNFTEQFVLGQLYKQALEAKGYNVNLKNNIGSTEIIDKALTGGKLDFYPEYVGILLSTTAKDTKAYGSR